MRFTRVIASTPRTKIQALKNELQKPLWEYAPGQIAGKPTRHQGPPMGDRYENEYDRIRTPRLAPHLDPTCSLAGVPRDIQNNGWVSCGKYAAAGSGAKHGLHEDLARFRGQYWIQLERRRCGGSPKVHQDRDVYDIVLKDTKAVHPALTFFSKHKENVELLGQYDGQPNKFNEKVLSLDVEKILYYVGLGVSLGQDVAELLGVCGILPIHPQTNLRLKKLHETRKNMLHKNADQLNGHDNAMEAAFEIIQNLDRQERIDSEGFDTFYYQEEEWTQHDQKIAQLREERENRRNAYEQKIEAEREKVEEARQRYYNAIKTQQG